MAEPREVPEANETRPRQEERASAAGQESPHWVSVRLGDTQFAIEIERVREVMPPPQTTLVPKAPPALRGIVSIRGDVVPVLDLGVRLLGSPARADGRLLVVSYAPTGEPVGLLVDQVTGLIAGLDKDVEQPPKEVTASLPEDVVRGVIEGPDGGSVAVLQLDRVLEIDSAARGEAD